MAIKHAFVNPVADQDVEGVKPSHWNADLLIEDETIESDHLATGIDAAKIADGTVSNAEFQYLNGLTGNIQTQIDGIEGGTTSAADIVQILIANGLTVTPPAPASLTVDDSANTATFTIAPGYPIGDGTNGTFVYEYSKDAGATWNNQTDLVIEGVTEAIDIGDFYVRVKASTNVNTGVMIDSSAAFTSGGGVGGTVYVTWRDKTNMSDAGNDIARSGGDQAIAATVETISAASGTPTYFEFMPTSGTTTLGGAYSSIYLAPSGNTFASQWTLDMVPGGIVRINGNNAGSAQTHDASNSPFSYPTVDADTDVFRLGFNGDGKLTLWKNGTIHVTNINSTTYTGTWVLVVGFYNAGGANVLRNVSVTT